jgi:hypothetical protein
LIFAWPLNDGRASRDDYDDNGWLSLAIASNRRLRGLLRTDNGCDCHYDE